MSSKTLPIIGLTCGEVQNIVEPWAPNTFGQSRTYVESIIRGGGVPLLLPLTDNDALLDRLLSLCDGICLAGGIDLHPRLYGQTPQGSPEDYDQLRDATEQKILQYVLKTQKPLLGICRGMQLMNVDAGGTLYQEIAEVFPDALDHTASTKLESLVDLQHVLRVDATSRLADILGTEQIGTNAHHHQAIDRLGDGVVATAWTSDGVIEAVEMQNHPFAIGVQCHPESLLDVEPRWLRLFTAFADAAAARV